MDFGLSGGQVSLSSLGERFAVFRLQPTLGVEQIRDSMATYGQLSPVMVRDSAEIPFEVIDGFKRLSAARLLGLKTIRAAALQLTEEQAKASIISLNASHRLTEIEEGWLIRSLYRENKVNQPSIARLLNRDKSWVSRRLALVEDLGEEVQNDLRLGLISASDARELARLPRGNQKTGADAVIRFGLTAPQSARMVRKFLSTEDANEKAKVFDEPPKKSIGESKPTPKPTPSEQLVRDIATVLRGAGRIQTQLATPLSVLGEDSANAVRDALSELHPTLVKLCETVGNLMRSY